MNNMLTSWSTFDNFTGNLSSTFNSTALPTTPRPPAISVSVKIVVTVGMVVCVIAIGANSVVLAVLVRARRHFGSSVHILIANQSAIDLFAAVSALSLIHI